MTSPNGHDASSAASGVNGTANIHIAKSLKLKQAMNVFVVVRIALCLMTTYKTIKFPIIPTVKMMA